MRCHKFATIIGILLASGFARISLAEVAWPAEAYSSAVNLTSVEAAGAYNDLHVNLSGIYWNPVTRKMWLCRNGGPEGSKFWVLKEDGTGGYEVDTKNGNRGEWTNFGDLEDLTQANLNEEVIYLIVEGEERIKEFDVSTYGTAVLRNNWNTSPHMPLSGGSGAEGIVFVPDSFLTAAGFVDPSGNPRVSQNGMGGLMFVAHQNGGRIYVFDLNRTNGTFTYVGSYLTNYGESCALALDRSDGLLYIFHGANHNRTEVTTMASVVNGSERQFVTTTTYAPPTGSPGNSNMEGIAVVSNDDCSNSQRRFFLGIDDGGANSFFMFNQFPCTLTNSDADGDGVDDANDDCANTPSGATVTTEGCSCAQLGQSGPTISSHPSNGTVCSGATHQFCVNATGTGSLSYQWQKDTVNIGGATASCYTANAAGSYRCVVTDLCGNRTSNAATLSVNSAPSISAHPAGATICSGQTTQLCVTASGAGTLTYQWQKDSVNIGGATASCYTANSTGSYRCIVTNSCGSTNSNSATVTVNSAPSISAHPAGATICSGQTTQLCVTASGAGTLTYQWQKDSVNISGATASCYTANSAGSYRCVVTNSCGSTTSNSATVTVNSVPAISSQPAGGSVCSGQSLQLCVTASGAGPITYQWQLNSTNIGGATASCYTATAAGSYRCVVTNSCGSTTSNAVTLTVNTAAAISTHPASGTICSGGTRQFCVTASGTAPLTYQWQRDGTNIAGATSSCFTASLAGTYRCVVTNGCGSATSNGATLTVNNAPTVSAQPIDGTVCSGSTYQFCVTASGSGPFTYQWQRNTVNVSGATSSCHTTGTAGSYRCVVTNSCGSATSNSATLTVESTMLWYPDGDGDGFGDERGTGLSGCSQPAGYVSNLLDCDDTSAAVNPNAADVCDEDRNCDGDFPTSTTWYRDADADGFGDSAVTTTGCGQPSGYVADSSDCDDGNTAIHPGATEVCDGEDNNCNSATDELGDSDGDGVAECDDACPGTAVGASVNGTGCSCGQLNPGDDDADGVANCEDACASTPNGEPVDSDGCSCGQLNPGDDDTDGVSNCDDSCAGTSAGASIDEAGCSCEQLNPGDSDQDGVSNCDDSCPGTQSGTSVDELGCACIQKVDGDSDSDGVGNCEDMCPDTQSNVAVNDSGCSCVQLDPADDDGDGVLNCYDKCDGTASGSVVNEDGCVAVVPTIPDGGGISPEVPETTDDGNTIEDSVNGQACGTIGTTPVPALMVAMFCLSQGIRRKRQASRIR